MQVVDRPAPERGAIVSERDGMNLKFTQLAENHSATPACSKKNDPISETRSRQIIGCRGADSGVPDVFIKQLFELSLGCVRIHWSESFTLERAIDRLEAQRNW
jgi:hypothetical protein